MAVIKEYMNGSCRIRVHDDCIKGPEEVKKIIDNVSRIVLREELRREMERRKREGMV